MGLVDYSAPGGTSDGAAAGGDTRASVGAVAGGDTRASDGAPASDSSDTRGPRARVDSDRVEALTERMTASRVGERDREAFDLFEAANTATESGRAGGASRLMTTAGASAAFGDGQLNVPVHLDTLHDLSDEDLSSIGIERSDLETARTRGQAAVAWYSLATGAWSHAAGTASRAQEQRHARDTTGLSEADAARIQRLARSGDFDTIQSEFGERFAETTGLPAEELGMVARTSLLRSPSLQAEWAQAFREANGHAFESGTHGRPRSPRDEMARATDAVLEHHPELAELHERLGTSALGYYLGVGRTAENLNGWYHRAASSALPEGELDSMLERASPITTRDFHLADFAHGRAVADAAHATGDARSEMIARVARQWHVSPRAASQTFLEHGRPRCTSEAELQTVLDGLSGDRAISDSRFLQRYRAVHGERSH